MEFLWNEEKNLMLKQQRGVTFDMVVTAIIDNKLIDIVKHPNIEKFGHQKIYVVDLKGYCYLVPFVETGDGNIFLKTIFPSRKAVKEYKKEKQNGK